MLPFDYVQRFMVNMPRVVADQKAKFESDDLFKKLSRESEVRYTGHKDRPIDERRVKFKTACRDGFTEIAFTNSGINFQLFFGPYTNSCRDQCQFEQEKGKVHLKSSFIMNGVCVRWRGSIDLQRLDGVGCLEFDEELAKIEDARLRQQIDAYSKRVQEMEEKQRAFLPPRLKRPRNEIIKQTKKRKTVRTYKKKSTKSEVSEMDIKKAGKESKVACLYKQLQTHLEVRTCFNMADNKLDYSDFELPPCISWTETEVASWIEGQGFPQYKECFEKNFISGRKLVLLEASHLPKMGITDYNDIKITAAIRKLLNTKLIRYFRNLSSSRREPWALFLEEHSRTGSDTEKLTYPDFLQKKGLKHKE